MSFLNFSGGLGCFASSCAAQTPGHEAIRTGHSNTASLSYSDFRRLRDGSACACRGWLGQWLL